MSEDTGQLLYRLMFGGVTSNIPPAAGRKDLNVQAGDSTRYRLDFQAAAGLVGQAIWRSPVFWLRPDLGTGPGAQKQNAVPLWRTPVYGGTTSVFVTLWGIADLTLDLRFTSTELAMIDSPVVTAGQLPQISQPQDITADVYDGEDACILTFSPPAANGPVQFWQILLTVDQPTGVLGTVDLSVSWGAY